MRTSGSTHNVSTRLSDLYRAAFITGASTGLGRAYAEMLLSEGVRVWGTSRDVARLSELSANHGDRFMPIRLDLRDGAAAERAFLEADRASGGFNLVINNAGFGVFGDFAATDFAIWEDQLQVMLVNTARLAHAAVRQMRPRAGNGRHCVLANISSLAAEFPLPYQSAYNMCKAGLTALSESLMIECAGSKLVVLDVRPGEYRTDIDSSVLRPTQPAPDARLTRAWEAFERLMRSGSAPAHAAAALRRALLNPRSGTLRIGRPFQAVIAPFLSRFGSLSLKRRVQASYFDVS